MVLRQGLELAAAGLVLGLAGALLLARLIGSLLFRVSPYDRTTFAATGAVFAAAVAMACWLPARRAALVDPVVAIRQE
jgi:putative ABC transport system permease protein